MAITSASVFFRHYEFTSKLNFLDSVRALTFGPVKIMLFQNLTNGPRMDSANPPGLLCRFNLSTSSKGSSMKPSTTFSSTAVSCLLHALIRPSPWRSHQLSTDSSPLKLSTIQSMRSFTVERAPPPSRPFLGRFLVFCAVGIIVLLISGSLTYLAGHHTNVSTSAALINDDLQYTIDQLLEKCLSEYVQSLALGECESKDETISSNFEKLQETYRDTLRVVPSKWYHAFVGLQLPNECQKVLLSELTDFTELAKTTGRALSQAQQAVQEFEEAKENSKHGDRSLRFNVAANCRTWGMVNHTSKLAKRLEDLVRTNSLELTTDALWQLYEILTVIRLSAYLEKSNPKE